MTEFVASTPGDQPVIVPASVENRKRAEPLFPLALTTKSAAFALKTVPVGPPATVTVSADLAPTPLYSVELFVPLLEVHHGVVGPALRPQPFTSDVSVPGAETAVESETSGWTE